MGWSRGREAAEWVGAHASLAFLPDRFAGATAASAPRFSPHRDTIRATRAEDPIMRSHTFFLTREECRPPDGRSRTSRSPMGSR